jgi:hypothetical protein
MADRAPDIKPSNPYLDPEPTPPQTDAPDYSEQKSQVLINTATGKKTVIPGPTTYGRSIPITPEEFDKDARGGRIRRAARKSRKGGGAVEGKAAHRRLDRAATRAAARLRRR